MNQAKYETYTEDFKRSSVKLALESRDSYAKTARELGVKESTFYTWVDRYAPSKNLADMPLQEELRRLRSEVSKLQTERDILKKAAAYFAKHIR